MYGNVVGLWTPLLAFPIFPRLFGKKDIVDIHKSITKYVMTTACRNTKVNEELFFI